MRESARHPFRLELAPAFETWRPALERELAEVAEAFAARARWQAARAESPLRLVVVSDPAAAGRLCAELGVEGRPEVARTVASLRLAVVPLPCADPLLIAHGPPRSWRETLRHEAVHLLALDRPGLRAAPVWFQEGLAESFGALPADRWSMQGAADPALAACAPELALARAQEGLRAEELLDLRRRWAEAALALDEGPEPWRAVAEWRVRDLLARPHPVWRGPAVRGREFDPPGAAGRWLLAPYPGETLDCLVVDEWDGRAPLAWTISYGAGGRPEGGLVLEGQGAARVRVRVGRHGGLAAYLEPRAATTSQPLRGEGFGTRLPQRVRLSLDGAVLVVEGAAGAIRVPLDPALCAPPFAVRLAVRDGILVAEP